MDTDVRSPGGWIQLYGVRVSKAIYVGTATLLSALYIFGSLNITGNLNFDQNGTETGAVLKVEDLTRLQIFPITCNNTGGSVQISNAGAKYDTCISASPLTTSGALSAVTLECGAVPKPFAYDVSFVKSRNAGTGAALQNLGNKTAGSGSYAAYLTGSLVWNPVDYLKLGTLTSVPTTSGNNCKLWVTLSDKYGS